MANGPCNLVVYLGSGEIGWERRQSLEARARQHGYIKKGKVALSPFIVDVLEGRLKVSKDSQAK